MILGDPVPQEEWLARAVIFPTHLPQQRLSQESLLNFQPETDPDILEGWAYAFVMSVTCLSLATVEEVHVDGIALATLQNEQRPLPQKPEYAFFGFMRSYLGFYQFQTKDFNKPQDDEEQVISLFWPENGFEAHVNCCIRMTGSVEKRDRVNRRVRLIGLLWRSLHGPTRHLYERDHPFQSVVNALPLGTLPALV